MQVRGLHHNAYRCSESEETRKFYADFLGLPLVNAFEIRNTKTGRKTRALHSFYAMADGLPATRWLIQSICATPNGYVVELTGKRPDHDKLMDPEKNRARRHLDNWQSDRTGKRGAAN